MEEIKDSMQTMIQYKNQLELALEQMTQAVSNKNTALVRQKTKANDLRASCKDSQVKVIKVMQKCDELHKRLFKSATS